MFPQFLTILTPQTTNCYCTLTDPIGLKSIINNIQKVMPQYLSLSSDPNANSWSFYVFLKVHPFIFNHTLIISLVVPLVGNTFHLQLYQIHSIPIVHTMFHNTLTIQSTNPYLAITNDKQYYACPIDMVIIKCLV